MAERLLGSSNIWPRRFVTAAIIQGAGMVGLTIILVIGQASFMKPEVSRVIAAGGAGTWFTFGYLIYLIGVLGVAVSAIFYHILGAKIPRIFAWFHLVLMNVGITIAAGLMMHAGYIGGTAALPVEVGGMGFNPSEVHELIAPYVEPIAVSILVVTAGTVIGGAGYILAYLRATRTTS